MYIAEYVALKHIQKVVQGARFDCFRRLFCLFWKKNIQVVTVIIL